MAGTADVASVITAYIAVAIAAIASVTTVVVTVGVGVAGNQNPSFVWILCRRKPRRHFFTAPRSGLCPVNYSTNSKSPGFQVLSNQGSRGA